MDRHVVIPMFSGLWWTGLIGSVIGIVFFIQLGRRLSQPGEKKLRWAIAISIFIREIIWHFYLIYLGHWEVGASLPLHLCGISRMAGAYLLLRPNQLVFEYLILLGMAGAFQSFITPELTHGSDLLLIIDFYYAHAVIIGIALYAFFVMKMRLKKWSWLNIFILGHIILSLVGFINFFIGGNYIFLCERPMAENPIIQGEWPYYLFSFQMGALIHILIFWVLFRFLARKEEVPSL